MLGCAVIALGMATEVRGDPVRVTDGAIVIDFEGDFFFLRGAGFSIEGHMPDSEFIPGTFGPSCSPCVPGDLVNLSLTTNGEQSVGSGQASFGLKSFDEVFYRAEFNLLAKGQPFPDTTDFGLDVVQPFAFTGQIRAFTDPGFSSLVFSTGLFGRGRADRLYLREEETGVYFPRGEGQLVYRFQAVPEPASLILVGTTLCAAGARRWYKGRRASQ
jgi:hypothetical protein